MPFQTSTPPPVPVVHPIAWRTTTTWNGIPANSVYNNGPSFGLTGANTGVVGYQALASGDLVSGTGLIPALGNAKDVRLGGVNGTQRFAALLVAMLQTSPNPFPGLRWFLTWRLSVCATMAPAAAGTNSGILIGASSAMGYGGGQFLGPGIWLAVLGDGGPNWRAFAIDGHLSIGGNITVNVDTGVAATPNAPQLIEWVCGNTTGTNFVEARIDGVPVWTPALPVAAQYPVGQTQINFNAGALRGNDAADNVSLLVLDDFGPCVFATILP